jgi:Bifunctional DNA primase/polymerase, N-terminal
MTAFLDAALALAARELPVVPLHFPVQRRGVLTCSCGKRDCGKNAAKHPFGPLVPNGFKNATTDSKQITEWWRCYPQLNIGVSTAALVVLDVDPRHGGYECLAALEEEYDVIPHTWCVRTGSDGLHIYLAALLGATISNSVCKLGPGLDIRAKGGYVVVPPSVHISGNRYKWIFNPDEAPLAPAPGWLVKKLVAPEPQPQPAIITSYRPSVAAVRGVLSTIAGAREGERNAVLFWGACRLGEAVRDGLMSSDTALDLLINSAPPPGASFTRHSILATIRSGLRHGAGP